MPAPIEAVLRSIALSDLPANNKQLANKHCTGPLRRSISDPELGPSRFSTAVEELEIVKGGVRFSYKVAWYTFLTTLILGVISSVYEATILMPAFRSVVITTQ